MFDDGIISAEMNGPGTSCTFFLWQLAIIYVLTVGRGDVDAVEVFFEEIEQQTQTLLTVLLLLGLDIAVEETGQAVTEMFGVEALVCLAPCALHKRGVPHGDLPERAMGIARVNLAKVLSFQEIVGERLNGQQTLQGSIEEAEVIPVLDAYQSQSRVVVHYHRLALHDEVGDIDAADFVNAVGSVIPALLADEGHSTETHHFLRAEADPADGLWGGQRELVVVADLKHEQRGGDLGEEVRDGVEVAQLVQEYKMFGFQLVSLSFLYDMFQLVFKPGLAILVDPKPVFVPVVGLPFVGDYLLSEHG
jgi:hypothetical protein